MQDSVFIIFGIIIFVVMLQGLTIIIVKHFVVGGIRHDIEKLKSLLNEANNEDRKLYLIPVKNLPVSEKAEPFDFLKNYAPAFISNIIQNEYPQTIALVLSYLEPRKASFILQVLPAEVKSDVIRRIAVIDRTNSEIIRIVERALEQKLASCNDYNESNTIVGGIGSAVNILGFVDRVTEKQIIGALEDEDPELAEEIKKHIFIFEDIVMLNDCSIQKVMRELDSQELAKALKNVSTEVQNKIFRNMSKRAADMLKEDMEYMEPVRLKYVEEAQQTIVSIIRHLESTGEIVIARIGEGEMPCTERTATMQTRIIMNGD